MSGRSCRTGAAARQHGSRVWTGFPGSLFATSASSTSWRVVCDNLNTHLSESAVHAGAAEPPQACRRRTPRRWPSSAGVCGVGRVRMIHAVMDGRPERSVSRAANGTAGSHLTPGRASGATRRRYRTRPGTTARGRYGNCTIAVSFMVHPHALFPCGDPAKLSMWRGKTHAIQGV